MAMCFNYPQVALREELQKIANALSAPGKGIMAIDDGIYTIGDRFSAIHLENTKENRRKYRQVLLTTDKELGKYVSGALLSHESVYQKTDDGNLFIDLLSERGILAGVKVDTCAIGLFCSDNELVTEGLDDLGKRCAQYKKDGCHFAKWRGIITIGPNTPSHHAIVESASSLARFASICQEHGMVPIIEPAVLHEGDHSIERCQKVTENVFATVYKTLSDHHIYLEGTLLKPNIVIQGTHYPIKSSPEEIGIATLTAIQRTVPPAVPGILFLSGGQTEEEATINLNAINQCVRFNRCKKKPWALSFSFCRSLQATAFEIWGGKQENTASAQAALLKRAKANGEASLGNYISIPIQETGVGEQDYRFQSC